MLTCLTDEDALRLIRKCTLKEFFTQLVAALSNKLPELDVSSNRGEWSSISNMNHHLSRHSNELGASSLWATWSDVQSMHPLFIASWFWWEPLLQGAVAAQQLAPHRPQTLALVNADTRYIWVVVAAVYTMGVDEIELVECENSESWLSLLASLPVTVQRVAKVKDINSNWTVTDKPIPGPYQALKLAQVQPEAWYLLFKLLYRLSNELCTGHRVDFNQHPQHPDQALDRLLTY